MPTSTTIRRTSFFMEPPSECVDPEELAEACGNRTHRSRVPPAPNGFEVRAGHQPRCASVPRRRGIVSQPGPRAPETGGPRPCKHAARHRVRTDNGGKLVVPLTHVLQ